MIRSTVSWDIEQNVLKLVIIGHFLPFYPLKTPKIKILKMKKFAEISSFYTCAPKNHDHVMYGSWDMECDRQFFVTMDCFFAFYHLLHPENENFQKFKNTSKYYHFTNVYYNWQSYHIWFFRYGVQQTIFFVILDHFLSFYHPSNPKNENFIKLKKEPLEISSFYTSVTKIMIIFYTVSWIWHVTNVIIFHFGLFFAPLPPNSPKNKN